MDNLKEKYIKLQVEVIECIVDNINDPNKPDSIAGLFLLFDLSTTETKEDKMEKLRVIHDMYGQWRHRTIEEKLSGYILKLEYEERLNFTKAQLLEDFSNVYVKMNEMSEVFRNGEKSQVSDRTYFFHFTSTLMLLLWACVLFKALLECLFL